MIIPDDFVLLSSRLWLVKGLKPQNCRGLEGELHYFWLNQWHFLANCVFPAYFPRSSPCSSNGTDIQKTGESNFESDEMTFLSLFHGAVVVALFRLQNQLCSNKAGQLSTYINKDVLT